MLAKVALPQSQTPGPLPIQPLAVGPCNELLTAQSLGPLPPQLLAPEPSQ